jgi:2-desacetyl-2-hydroxyethyl bacteriochlorophyllide A dehydrogenase
MSRQVKATAPGKLELHESDNLAPGPGQVALRVSRCGVCGSDLHWFHGNGPTPAVCPGHEMCGEIESLGDGVEGLHSGQRVAVEPLLRCGACAACLRGDYHLCPRLGLLGITAAGGMADRVLAPAECLYSLPDSVDDSLGALVEPTAVCVHAARLGGIGEDSNVLVLGAGSIGLLSVVAARQLGARHVAVSARYPAQKELALALGCDEVIDPTRVTSSTVKPDVVIETVGGSADTLADSVEAVAPGGRIIMVGVFDHSPAFNPMTALMKEVTITAAMVYNRPGDRSDFDVAIGLLDERSSDMSALVTHTFPLEQAQAAFECASDKSSGSVKVQLAP